MTTPETKLKFMTTLRGTKILGELETDHLKKLVAVAHEAEFSAGEPIYNEGQVGTAVYIVLSGQVALEMKGADNRAITLHTFNPGELFGWSSLFPSETKKARARATKPTQLLVLDAAKVRATWKNDQLFENALINCTALVMLDRIRATRRQLAEALATGQPV